MTQHALAARPVKRPKGAVYLVVQADGSFRCADELSRDTMRRKRIKVGNVLRAELTKPRDYTQWKKAHALGKLLAQNVEEFAQFDAIAPDAHGALKHLQKLSGVACDDTIIRIPGSETIVAREVRSLAFGEMDETEFQEIYSGFCGYIRKRAWLGDVDQSQIEDMAKLIGDGG